MDKGLYRGRRRNNDTAIADKEKKQAPQRLYSIDFLSLNYRLFVPNYRLFVLDRFREPL